MYTLFSGNSAQQRPFSPPSDEDFPTILDISMDDGYDVVSISGCKPNRKFGVPSSSCKKQPSKPFHPTKHDYTSLSYRPSSTTLRGSGYKSRALSFPTSGVSTGGILGSLSSLPPYNTNRRKSTQGRWNAKDGGGGGVIVIDNDTTYGFGKGRSLSSPSSVPYSNGTINLTSPPHSSMVPATPNRQKQPLLVLPSCCYSAVEGVVRVRVMGSIKPTKLQVILSVRNDPVVRTMWYRGGGDRRDKGVGRWGKDDQVSVLESTMAMLDIAKGRNTGGYKGSGEGQEDGSFEEVFGGYTKVLMEGMEDDGFVMGRDVGVEDLVKEWFVREEKGGVGKGVGMGRDEFGELLKKSKGNITPRGNREGVRNLSEGQFRRINSIRKSVVVEDMTRGRRGRLEEDIGKWKSPRVRRREVEEMERRKVEEEKKKMTKSFRVLTREENQVVDGGLRGGEDEGEVVATVGGDSITRRNLRTLNPGTWLSDEVIHYYYSLLRERDERICKETGGRRSWFFKSFFFTKLVGEGGYNYKNVKRWSKKVPGKDIFELENILWPLNLNNMHWCCLKADMRSKTITYYDSFGSKDTHGFLEATLRYLKDEWKAKDKPGEFDDSEWTLYETPADYPQQTNGYDCGVFTCTCADFLSLGKETNFTQRDVTGMRRLVALRILKNKAD